MAEVAEEWMWQTDRQTEYCNPCACALRVNNGIGNARWRKKYSEFPLRSNFRIPFTGNLWFVFPLYSITKQTIRFPGTGYANSNAKEIYCIHYQTLSTIFACFYLTPARAPTLLTTLTKWSLQGAFHAISVELKPGYTSRLKNGSHDSSSTCTLST